MKQNKLVLRLTITIKFRAFGQDIAHVADVKQYDLPAALEAPAELIGLHELGSYDGHGFHVRLDLIEVPVTAPS